MELHDVVHNGVTELPHLLHIYLSRLDDAGQLRHNQRFHVPEIFDATSMLTEDEDDKEELDLAGEKDAEVQAQREPAAAAKRAAPDAAAAADIAATQAATQDQVAAAAACERPEKGFEVRAVLVLNGEDAEGHNKCIFKRGTDLAVGQRVWYTASDKLVTIGLSSDRPSLLR